MSQAIRYEDSRVLIGKMVRKVERWMRSAGSYAASREDIEGELNIAWCIARDKYDPATGVPFGAYLWRGMQLHINRWAREQIEESHQTLSMNNPVGGSHEDADADFQEILPDPSPLADKQLLEKDVRGWVLTRLTATTRRVVEWLENPPPVLLEELKALQARSEWGRARGLLSIAPTDVTLPMIFDLMGLDRRERTKVYAEFKSFAARVSQC